MVEGHRATALWGLALGLAAGFAGEGAISEEKAVAWISWHVSKGAGTSAGPPITVLLGSALAL